MRRVPRWYYCSNSDSMIERRLLTRLEEGKDCAVAAVAAVIAVYMKKMNLQIQEVEVSAVPDQVTDEIQPHFSVCQVSQQHEDL